MVRSGCIEDTHDSTPAAMVLRVKAGIAILKAPAVGEKVSWIALSIMRHGAFVWNGKDFLVIDWRNHDTNINR